MELISDAEGAISFGWLEPKVFYSRFSGKLSTILGATHLQALEKAVDAGSSIHYFADSSELSSYDLLARSAYVRLLLSSRRRFAELVILTWSEGLSRGGQALAASVGEPLEILESRIEFERRLAASAPRGVQLIRAARHVRTSHGRDTTASGEKTLPIRK